jgi:hypothetical protein
VVALVEVDGPRPERRHPPREEDDESDRRTTACAGDHRVGEHRNAAFTPPNLRCDRCFVAFHTLLLQLPAYREVVAYGSSHTGAASLPKAALRRLDDGLALLTNAGFSDHSAREAFSACYNWTRGMAVLRQDRGSASEDGVVAEVIAVSDDRFRAGLRLLIAGVAATARVADAKD